MQNPNVGVVIFTAIELVTLVVWLVLAGVPLSITPAHVAAVAVLGVGLFFEHFVSYNVGTGQPPLTFPLVSPKR